MQPMLGGAVTPRNPTGAGRLTWHKFAGDGRSAGQLDNAYGAVSHCAPFGVAHATERRLRAHEITGCVKSQHTPCAGTQGSLRLEGPRTHYE